MSQPRYLVTARKYRPQRFNEIVGQEHVAETLKNAIRQERVAHAYLFSGPRGVGKTTAARILARAINCTGEKADRPDGVEPCMKCEACVTSVDGRNMSVIEIDAASNNKVDDVRELRETVRIPPQGALRKVYIIDEVHMLTASAFNALLKTLEEPPPYVLFIFATTEPRKVLPTILSRCQRFDFRRITTADAIRHLSFIAKEEDVRADEDALRLIARKGDGALRDSLSAFDQAVSLCGSDLTYEAIAGAFRVVDVDRFFGIAKAIEEGDSRALLDAVEHISSGGYDLGEFLGGLSEHLRNLLVARTMPDATLIDASDDVRKRYLDQGGLFDEPDLLRLLMIASETEAALRDSARPRLAIELCLLKMCHLARVTDLRDAIAGAEPTAPKRLPDAAASTSRKSPPKTKAPDSKTTGKTPSRAARNVENAEPAVALASTADVVADKHPDLKPERRDTPLDERAEDPTRPTDASDEEQSPKSKATDEEQSPKSKATDEEQSPKSKATDDSDSPTRESTSQTDAETDSSGPHPKYPDLFGPPALGVTKGPAIETRNEGRLEGTAALKPVADPSPSHKPELQRQVEKAWLRYVKGIKSSRIQIGSLLQHTAPCGCEAQRIQIAVPDEFHRRLLTSQEHFLTSTLLKQVPGIEGLRFIVRSRVEPFDGSETADDFDPYEYMMEKRKENAVVRAIFDEFGGELVW